MLQKLFYSCYKLCPVLFWQKWKRPQIKLRLSSVYLECSAVVDRYTLGLIGNVQERRIITLAYPTWILICFGVFEKRFSDRQHVLHHKLPFCRPFNDSSKKELFIHIHINRYTQFDGMVTKQIFVKVCSWTKAATICRTRERRTGTNWSNNAKRRPHAERDGKIG